MNYAPAALLLAFAACSRPMAGPGWRELDIDGHRYAVDLPAAPDAVAEIYSPPQRRLIGRELTSVQAFGTIDIETSAPFLHAPESVRDYRSEALADGRLTTYWIPSTGIDTKSFTVFYRRTIGDVEITCGHTFVRPVNVQAVKAICASLKSIPAS